jgi:hypothetical protein
MSTPMIPSPALLFLSILSSRWECFWPCLLDDLQDHFGPLAYQSDLLQFDYTTYYDAELGTPISRRILAFERLAPQDFLVQTKLLTNELEQRLTLEDGRRLCNLDPGLLCLERLVLGTGKNYTHRIYLADGIWADLTLIHQHGQWKTLPWTFPDYADREMQEHLTRLRDLYKTLLAHKR